MFVGNLLVSVVRMKVVFVGMLISNFAVTEPILISFGSFAGV